MASVTLAESAKLSQDMLVAGVIENIITVNRMFDLLPFDGIHGNAIAYNREKVLGEVGVAGVDTLVSQAVNPITSSSNAKAPAQYDQISAALTTLLGDAEVNGLIQATRSNINDQKAQQIASKAKHLGRLYQDLFINGSGSANQFKGLELLVAAGQKVDTGVDGSVLSFDIMDQLIDLVKDKDGQVDYFTMPAKTIRSYFALLRALGGAGIGEVVTLPSGGTVPGYRGIPIFQNDWILHDVTVGASLNTGSIYAGTFDDGSRSHGIAGLTAENAAGIQVVEVGEAQDADNSITRVKWYCGLANFSELGLASAPGIKN
jgi:hypothetical protein